MSWRPRIEKGLPRGGLGYLGLAVCICVFAVTRFRGGTESVVVAWAAVPVCVWLAIGLRIDDRYDESIDVVIEEARPRIIGRKWIEGENKVFFWRISTAIVLLSAFNVWLAYHLETRCAEEPGREVMETIPAIGADLTDGSIIRHVKLEPVPHHIDARGRRDSGFSC